MGWEHEPGTVWRAQELYCLDRMSFERVAEMTGVATSTLKRWADKYRWRERREELAQVESEIRFNTIMGRKAILQRLLEAEDGKEASQVAFAVAAQREAVRNKVGMALSDPEKINAATVQDTAAQDPSLPAGMHRVVVTGIGECWMRATVDGEVRQFSVRKGDIITLEFAKALEVKLGNAGGVQVSYDGTELPAPGQAGQVKTLVFPPAAN